jgi:hypothetical protein
MNDAVADTDYSWYDFPSRQSASEVKLWTPSGHPRWSVPESSPLFWS